MSDSDHHDDRERQLRNTALHAAMQLHQETRDCQLLIRAARDILAFLKEG
jgi:hypothetical protein